MGGQFVRGCNQSIQGFGVLNGAQAWAEWPLSWTKRNNFRSPSNNKPSPSMPAVQSHTPCKRADSYRQQRLTTRPSAIQPSKRSIEPSIKRGWQGVDGRSTKHTWTSPRQPLISGCRASVERSPVLSRCSGLRNHAEWREASLRAGAHKFGFWEGPNATNGFTMHEAIRPAIGSVDLGRFDRFSHIRDSNNLAHFI